MGLLGKKKIKQVKEDTSIDVKQELGIKEDVNMTLSVDKDVKKSMANVSSNFEYDIELWDVWDTTSKRRPIFGANRLIEDNNVYLFNEKTGFKIPFPENSEEYKQYKMEELDSIIKSIETKIKNNNKGKADHTLKDLNKDLRVHRNYKRSLELQGRGSYMVLNYNGRPMFMFDRVGNLKMPLFKNVDRSLIYTPTEQKTQEVTQLLKENKEKNGEQVRLNLATYALIIILALLVGIMFYTLYKMSALPVEVSESLARTGELFAQGAKDLNSANSIMYNITENLQTNPDLITTPTTQIITGR